MNMHYMHPAPPRRAVSRRLRTLGLSMLIGATAAFPAHADDTEIYTGLNNLSGAVDPNVLFIIDTSGSMGTTVSSVVAPYDASTTYSGSCDNDFIYWSSSGSVPTCSTSQRFRKDKFRCAAANTPLFSTGATGTGLFQDRVARFSEGSFFFFSSSSTWESLSTFQQDPPHVECRADEGIHGAQDFDQPPSGAATYIINSNSAYTDSFASRRNWDSTGSFVTLYSTNYMNYFNNSNSVVSSTRINIVKDVVKSIIDSNTNLNVGLMRFDTGDNRGGPIIFPFSDVDASGVKTSFKNTVDVLTATGNTPLAETMREASRIFRGEQAVAGLEPNNIKSVPASFLPNSTVYDTPLDVQCQKNFIIYLTDGQPTQDNQFDSDINNLISGASVPSGDTSCGGSDNCLDEMAEFLNEVDQIPGLPGKQNVVTYTIGFFTDQTLLSQTAIKGGGSYYLASDFAQLSNAFTQIITEIQAVNTTFTAPAVSVNAFNRVTNRKELYFTLFKPKVEPLWTGNVKRYELDFLLDGNGDPVDSDGDGVPNSPEILDVNGAQAVDPQTGFFASNATSFWTAGADAPDGDETSKGGAARLLGGTSAAPTADSFANRTVYTHTGTTTNLADASNLMSTANLAITSAMLGKTGASGEPDRETLILWRGGLDVKDEDADGDFLDARRIMGDPLHTKPVLLTYGSSDADPDITLFMATNEGVIHAIDTDNGIEVFSYVPPQHLSRTLEFFTNSATGAKAYGIDGDFTVFFKDDNGNGILETTSPNADRYILVVGERRGGTRYYALDVTNRAAPKVLWTIQGGQGGTLSGAGPYYEMGQTWAGGRVSRVKVNGTVRDVVVISGGYDPDQDNPGSARGVDDSGRAIYMVDVFTGELVWWAGKSGITGPVSGDPTPDLPLTAMNFSFPADIRVIDLNGDGFVDRMYAADMGGQLWRFDVDNEDNTGAGDLVDGHLMADLQKSSTGAVPGAADNRRFYYAPDVSLVLNPDQPAFLAVALGSGYRAHPLDVSVKDRFYMVMDRNPFAKPTTYPATRTEGDLKDVTIELNPDLTGFEGWFIQLADFGSSPGSVGTHVGEKVLSESVTFDGKILFTTFQPVASVSAGDCAPNQGTGKTYLVSVTDASPVQDLDTISSGSGLTRSDRALTLVRTGIAPEVTILFPPLEGVDPVALVAAEKLDLELNNPPVKTYWFQQEQQ